MEAKAKISAARKGKKHYEETKALISAATVGENNPMYGRKHSEETKAKISETTKGTNNPMYGTVSPTAQLFLYILLIIFLFSHFLHRRRQLSIWVFLNKQSLMRSNKVPLLEAYINNIVLF